MICQQRWSSGNALNPDTVFLLFSIYDFDFEGQIGVFQDGLCIPLMLIAFSVIALAS